MAAVTAAAVAVVTTTVRPYALRGNDDAFRGVACPADVLSHHYEKDEDDAA